VNLFKLNKMKAKITKDGLLIIESETDIESYALKHWIKENPINESLHLMFMTHIPYDQKEEIKNDN
jgi:hypothetical protein